MQKDRVIAVRYVGDGAWYQGIPARDLTEAEVESFGQSVEGLTASGFYDLPLTPEQEAELAAKQAAEAAALANATANNNQGNKPAPDSTKK